MTKSELPGLREGGFGRPCFMPTKRTLAEWKKRCRARKTDLHDPGITSRNYPRRARQQDS